MRVEDTRPGVPDFPQALFQPPHPPISERVPLAGYTQGFARSKGSWGPKLKAPHLASCQPSTGISPWPGRTAQHAKSRGNVVETHEAVSVEVGGRVGVRVQGAEHLRDIVHAYGAVVVDVGIAGIAEAIRVRVDLAGIGGFKAVVGLVCQPIEISIPEGLDVEGSGRGSGLRGRLANFYRRDCNLAGASIEKPSPLCRTGSPTPTVVTAA